MKAKYALAVGLGFTLGAEKWRASSSWKVRSMISPRHRLARWLGNDALLASWVQPIASLAARHKIPSVFSGRPFVVAGGLIAYGPWVPDLYRMLGAYTGRVLKGANPADLPVFYPTEFDLIINLKTAKTLAVSAPTDLLARADEVIE